MDKEKNFISVVVYVHDGEEQIERFANMFIPFLETNFEHSEIIFVNDFSMDYSKEKLRNIESNNGTVAISILNMSYFHGMEIAMNAGVDLSIGDYVLEIDDLDINYSLQQVMRAYRKVMEGYDIVGASPNMKQKLSSTLFYWVYAKFSMNKQIMCSERFRILSRRAINRISGMSKTVPYRKGIYLNCGLKNYSMIYDVEGKEVVRKTDVQVRKYRRQLAIDSLLLFTDVGYVFAKVMTGFMMLASLVMFVYAVTVYLLGNPVEGWTTTIFFLTIAFFGLFGILTVIIKYLQIMLNLIFSRTKYSYESIEKISR